MKIKKGCIVERTVNDHGEDEVKQYVVVKVSGDVATLKRANRQGIIYEVDAPTSELTVVREKV